MEGGQAGAVLHDIAHAKPGGLLHQLGSTLSVLESLAHVLCWGPAKLTDATSLRLELPRIGLNFAPRLQALPGGGSKLRLYCTELQSTFVSERTEAELGP